MSPSIRGRGAACLAPLLAALSFTAAAQTPAARAADAPAGVCTPARPHPAGLASFTVESGGRERRYFLYVPPGYDGASPRPLVLDFHGSGSHPRQQLAIDGMARQADAQGFLVLLPEAAVPFPPGGHTWNAPPDPRLPDDVRFAEDALADAARRVCVDPARVYATGFSGGARLASELACARPDRIAALGAVGGLRAPQGCGPVPVIAFHGTADRINPYVGGGPAYWGYGVDAAVRGWARANGCAASPVEAARGASVTARRYAQCDGAAVAFYRVDGGGHTWPGSAFPFPPERFGATTREIDATAVMLEFFRAHGGRTRPAATAGSG
ncbi:MAG TPA: PHB depolymerase family esterase, partial [Pelomicrobium sp.]|nr:PHB depolymerase family esterase [Pelomicrobium sp.]